MTNNITQVGLIKIRRGKAEQLPYALEEGEFGLATDTLELFIGAPNANELSNRMSNKIYPYGNLRILTELSEPLEIQSYTYKGNTKTAALFPIILKGATSEPTVAANTSVKFNNTEITFDTSANLAVIVDKINSANVLNTKAYNLNNYLVIVSTDNALKIVNINGTFIQSVGLSADPETEEISEVAKNLIETTIQAVLDEYLTIKHYNAKGDGNTDDTDAINDALLGTYSVSEETNYLRTIYFPAGTYLTTSQINIPSNARLLGEGKERTVIKSMVGASGNMIGFLDEQKIPSNSPDYCHLDEYAPKNITIENITFDGSDIIQSIVDFNKCSDITFRNCGFKGSQDTIIAFEQSNNLHITFEDCEFEDGLKGIDTGSANVDHMNVLNCRFKDITEQAIILGTGAYKTHLLNNCFMNCAALEPEVILVNGDKTVLLESVFDDTVESFESTPIPFTDNTGTINTDIFDPTGKVDGMVYKYHYPQPVWGYIDSLQNSKGQFILKPVYGQNDENIVNWVYLKAGNEADETVEIYTEDKFKDFFIGGGQYANLILGDCSDKYPTWSEGQDYVKDDYVEYDGVLYKCQSDHTSVSYADLSNPSLWSNELNLNEIYVLLGKNLNLNGHYITSNQNENIVLKPNGNNSVVYIDDDNYMSKIDSISKAVATVEYVKANIATKSFTLYTDIGNYLPIENWQSYNLGTLDANSYGSTIYVKNVTVSVENIFRKLNFATAVEWTADTICYKGDLYAHLGSYYIAKVTHANHIWYEEQWEEVNINGFNPDSIRVYAKQGSNTVEIVPAGQVKLWEKEETYPVLSTYKAEQVQGNVYGYCYSRYTNLSDYTFYLDITDDNGNIATNWQPSGRMFVNIDFMIA